MCVLYLYIYVVINGVYLFILSLHKNVITTSICFLLACFYRPTIHILYKHQLKDVYSCCIHKYIWASI